MLTLTPCVWPDAISRYVLAPEADCFLRELPGLQREPITQTDPDGCGFVSIHQALATLAGQWQRRRDIDECAIPGMGWVVTDDGGGLWYARLEG